MAKVSLRAAQAQLTPEQQWNNMPGSQRSWFLREFGSQSQEWMTLAWAQLPPAARQLITQKFQGGPPRPSQSGSPLADRLRARKGSIRFTASVEVTQRIVKKAIALRAADLYNSWGKYVTPTQAFNPVLMGQGAKTTKGNVYEVEGSSVADPQLDKLYGIPSTVLQFPQANLSVLDDRVRLVDQLSGKTLFVTPIELDKFFQETSFNKSRQQLRNPKAPLDQSRDMPDKTDLHLDPTQISTDQMPTGVMKNKPVSPGQAARRPLPRVPKPGQASNMRDPTL